MTACLQPRSCSRGLPSAKGFGIVSKDGDRVDNCNANWKHVFIHPSVHSGQKVAGVPMADGVLAVEV